MRYTCAGAGDSPQAWVLYYDTQGTPLYAFPSPGPRAAADTIACAWCGTPLEGCNVVTPVRPELLPEPSGGLVAGLILLVLLWRLRR